MTPLHSVLAAAEGGGGPGLLVLGMFGLVAAVAVFGWLRERQRRQQRDAYAAANGWEQLHPGRVTNELMSLLPTSSGSFRERVTWAARVPTEREGTLIVCDYSYKTRKSSGSSRSGSRSKTRTHRKAAAVHRSPASLPALELRRKGLFGSIVSALSSRTVEVESAAFNKRFLVLAKDQRSAIAILDARTQERLLELDPEDVQLKWGNIVVVDSSRRKGEDGAPQHVALAAVCEAVQEGVPDWVSHDVAEDAADPDWNVKEPDAV